MDTIQIFIFIFGGTLSVTNTVKVNKEGIFTDPSLITVLLEKILRLGQESLNDDEISFKFNKGTRFKCRRPYLEEIVRTKLIELRPYLQDDSFDESNQENNLTLKGNDETTIIEFVPDDKDNFRDKPFKKDIKNYNNLRKRIHKALLTESVSDETIDLVIQTLDDMIASMIENQCSWKYDSGKEKILRGSSNNIMNFSEIPETWNIEWKKIKEKYLDLFNNNTSMPPDSLSRGVRSLLEKIPSFFSKILKNGEMLTKQYNFKCQKGNRDSENVVNSLLPGVKKDTRKLLGLHNKFSNIVTHRNSLVCRKDIQICTEELKRFLLYIYKYINSVTAKVLNDYIEMYKIEVNTEGKSYNKGTVLRLREVNHEIGNLVCNTFTEKIRRLKIDKGIISNPSTKSLKFFIKDIVDNVKLHTNKSLHKKFDSRNSKLKENIIRDIEVNMKIELERLVNELYKTICTTFKTCNSRYIVKNSRRGHSDRNSVYVKVHLTSDDELKNDLNQKSRRMLGLGATEINKIRVSRTTLKIQNPTV
ncbi:unnamed protein product [Parnassius apollo]|uniref:(apollo) hypothetical protein n=1 Tax=Parnassius apollo TaxID=110799 RepID=A0A8S3WXR7_PARAO|nr:unnamed protein product [Parnassius apollo]